MVRNNKFKTVFVLSTFAIIILILVFILNTKKPNKTINVYGKEDIVSHNFNISKERIEVAINESIKDRCNIYSDDCILVGENDKQLENGFYDIKFDLENIKLEDNRNLVIHINKLWKNFNDKLYEESYIDEVVTVIEKIFGKEENTNKLKENIKEEYIKSKSLEENLEKKSLKFNDIAVDLETTDKELIVTISY